VVTPLFVLAAIPLLTQMSVIRARAPSHRGKHGARCGVLLPPSEGAGRSGALASLYACPVDAIANGGDLALSLFVAAVLAGSFVLLGVVCWIFWRAAKADRAEQHGEQ
jgi:hypothetical protein